MLGARRCLRFGVILFVSTLTMWAMTRIVLTAVPEGGDSCPVGKLPSEPLCVVTDDMTYQEQIEALSGTM